MQEDYRSEDKRSPDCESTSQCIARLETTCPGKEYCMEQAMIEF
jgi:hypothetical protein